MDKKELLNHIKNRLIVSCQAEGHEPLGQPHILAAMAKAAVLGGAAGIRANYPENIRAIARVVKMPVIGIFKKEYADSPVFITPTEKEAMAVAATGCAIIAMDATRRVRPENADLSAMIAKLRASTPALLMADIATLDDARHATKLGFDLIGTTLSGYTEETKARAKDNLPDFELLQQCVKEFAPHIPVIAEGRIWTPEQARQALDLGAHAVVVGSAITRPWLITERFVKAMK